MDEKTIQTYNQTAKAYDEETVDFWNRFPRTFLDAFAKQAQGKIIDIGSGPGRDGLLLQQQGLSVVCLDASKAMVELCQQKGLQSVLGDFAAMPFENSAFDGAWAYTSLLHVPKKELPAALNEISRILKNDGVLGLGLIEGTTEGYKESPDNASSRWFSYYTKPETEKLLNDHGFAITYFEQFKPGSRNYFNIIAKKQ